MTTITQPKRGEVQRWMLWVMALGIVGLSSTVWSLYQTNAEIVRQKDAEIKYCQEERTKAEATFRQEITKLYQEVQDFREEIYRTSQSQQRRLKQIKK